MEGADPPSPSPDPCYLPALTKKKKKIKESAHPRWVDSQSANQLLAHWLCHQAWILRKDPLLCRCLCCSRCCICVCVCEEAWWNEMPGLGYLQGEPLHPITWASQQHSGIGEKLHPSSDGPPEDQAWSNGRGDFFFLIILLCCGETGLLSPPTSILFLKSGAPSFLVRLHSFCFLPPRSSRGAHWNIKPPCMTICTCMDLKTLRRWVFGWVCVWVCFCALSCVFFDGISSLHTHTYIHTYEAFDG